MEKIHKVLDIKTGEHVEYDRKDVPDLVKEIKKLETLAEKQKAIYSHPVLVTCTFSFLS
jgi:hypothetical protein